MKQIRCFKVVKSILVIVLSVCFMMQSVLVAHAAAPALTSQSVILMEETTGQVIYEVNADERRSPASITKIMTMILVFEAIENGKITMQDEVVTSAHAMSMGGSQVYLEEGEVQTVETLLKCVAVASGNDASVALAEYVGGTEEAFVIMMNEKAAELGMNNTNFVDCCGLTDSLEHYSTARDIAVMSCYLIHNYPEVYDFTTIWMEDIIHSTNRGDSVFTISSTNKLLKQYPYTTGLKTGFTNNAKYCVSATARKDNISLIAVVMSAETSDLRNKDAMSLLNYGFSVSRLYQDTRSLGCDSLPVKGAVVEEIPVACKEQFSYLDITGMDFANVERKIMVREEIEAPVQMGQSVGKIVYTCDGKELGSVDIVALTDAEKASLWDFYGKVFIKYLL
ncbi:MAG: D-alanyl-D-alanine carboxypeptidase [Lachnospiraceae bacterium]|nr:D-alanyl-D-alanine carboxypeptidase [Lachnospiraceae bacterium]